MKPLDSQTVAADAQMRDGPYWATELPALRPSMLVPRNGAALRCFPFDAPGVQYVHFARNAIYHLARQKGLAGNEVLFPAYFHGVELEALLAAGVKPRYYAVRDGMRVDPDDIADALTPQTRAVYMIHYVGFPGPADIVRDMCRERGLYFIEDCALALLSRYGDRPLGSFGDAAVFCLYKTLPAPDGGAVVVRDGALEINGVRPGFTATARQAAASMLNDVERRSGALVGAAARFVKAAGKRLAGREDSAWVDVGTQNFDVGDVDLLMSDIARRIVATQDPDAIVRARRRNYEHLQSLLAPLAPPIRDSLGEGVCPLFYPFVTERKLDLWKHLRNDGIQSVLFWLGGDLGPSAGEFPEVDRLRRTVLELPCHQDLTPQHIERVAQSVLRATRRLGA